MLNEVGDGYDARVRYYTNEYGSFGHWGNTTDWRTAYRIWSIAFGQAHPDGEFYSAGARQQLGNADSFQPQQLKNLTEVVYRAFALYFNSRSYMSSRAEAAQLKRILGSPPRDDIRDIVKANYKDLAGAGHLPLSELNKLVNVWREIFLQLSQELGAAYGVGDRAMIEGLVKIIDGWASKWHSANGIDGWLGSGFYLPFMGTATSANGVSLPRSLDISYDTMNLIMSENPRDSLHLKSQIIGAMIQGML